MMRLFVVVLCFAMLQALAQGEDKNDSLKLPHIPGFQTLKCDFHLHTVFSDGHVWPSFRVKEAERDGLDVISLTEHIDYEGYPDEVKRNYNRSYEIARDAAAKTGKVLVIRGAEISPRVPPYHNNALFLKDANRFPTDYMKEWKKKFVMKESIAKEELMAPFLEAKRQDAFVFYNHPGYSWWDKKDTNIFTSFHKELLDKDILGGVEVVNSNRYNIIAHRMAMKYNLTMIGNSDEHHDIYQRYYKTHRPMTLVFAKAKTEEAIREALQQRRTAVYFDDYIVARQPEAEAFFKSSLDITTEKKTRNEEPLILVKIFNRSPIPYKVRATSEYNIENYPMGQFVLEPGQTTTLTLKAVWKYPAKTTLNMIVSNVLVTPDEGLHTKFDLDLERAI
jgi:3',5'-nucleoside bisphosphate phosphatase